MSAWSMRAAAIKHRIILFCTWVRPSAAGGITTGIKWRRRGSERDGERGRSQEQVVSRGRGREGGVRFDYSQRGVARGGRDKGEELDPCHAFKKKKKKGETQTINECYNKMPVETLKKSICWIKHRRSVWVWGRCQYKSDSFKKKSHMMRAANVSLLWLKLLKDKLEEFPQLKQAALHHSFTQWLTCEPTNSWDDPPGRARKHLKQLYFLQITPEALNIVTVFRDNCVKMILIKFMYSERTLCQFLFHGEGMRCEPWTKTTNQFLHCFHGYVNCLSFCIQRAPNEEKSGFEISHIFAVNLRVHWGHDIIGVKCDLSGGGTVQAVVQTVRYGSVAPGVHRTIQTFQRCRNETREKPQEFPKAPHSPVHERFKAMTLFGAAGSSGLFLFYYRILLK